ncbi:hypothetical protein Nepgr_032574 [Nepenthes gracilis]|uniref:Uncharacterized protein n=1 Tax=Nepenthes gracilis TaxID=150966 RepID=A0AAD3TKB6_NEPGR|nr:hypothetical protein Nepgr_032574 [Nepenthes gracilis]
MTPTPNRVWIEFDTLEAAPPNYAALSSPPPTPSFPVNLYSPLIHQGIDGDQHLQHKSGEKKPPITPEISCIGGEEI